MQRLTTPSVASPTSCRVKSSRRRGVATLEMAYILVVMMTIVLGAIDLGRFLHAYIAVTNAARAGAGFAIMNPRAPRHKPPFKRS